MAKDDITLSIGVDAKNALSGLKKFGSTASKSISNLSKSLFSVQTAVAGIGAAIAGAGLAKAINNITQAASRQEDAVNSLNTALAISGEFTEAASKEMQAFASQIQATTKFGDELILEQLALAKAFGATNEQAKQVTQAAVELAAATGKSLEEATRQVSKTLGGFAGELGEVNPAIKALTAEQLKAGEAAQILIAQYGGSAAAQINTFSGAIAQTSNLFGDLQEELGKTITQNPAVIGAIKIIGDTFKNLIDVVKNNQGEIADFVGTLVKGLASGLPSIVDAVGFVAKAFQGLLNIFDTVKIAVALLAESFLSFDIVNTIIANLGNVFAALETAALEAFDAIVAGLENVLGFAAKIIPGLDSVVDGIKDFRKEIEKELEDIGEKAAENLIDTDVVKKSFDDIKQEALDSAAETNEFFAGIQDGIAVLRKSAVEASESIQGLGTSLAAPEAKQIEVKVTSTISEGIQEGLRIGGEFLRDNILSGLASAGEGFVSILSGGLFDAVSTGLNFLADIPKGFANGAKNLERLLKDLPGVITKIVDDLPKTIQKLLSTFVKQFPKFIKAISRAIPVIIDQLSEALPKIIGSIADALPGIISKLLDGFADFIDLLPEIFEKIFSKLPEIFDSIFDKLPKIITAIFNALPKIVKSFADAIPGIIESLADNIDEIVIAFVEGIIGAAGEIVAALIESFLLEGGAERIVGAILRAIPRVIVALVQGIARGLTRAFEAIISLFFGRKVEFDEDKLKKIVGNLGPDIKKAFAPVFDSFKTAFNTITAPFQRLIAALDNLRGSLGGGKDAGGVAGFFQDIGKKNTSTTLSNFGASFATGGIVPSGFPNDTFGANLTSGELVVPRNDVTDLRQFLAQERRGSGSLAGNEEITALLASIAGNTAASGGGVVTLNEDGLTELLLDFSRRNERTVA